MKLIIYKYCNLKTNFRITKINGKNWPLGNEIKSVQSYLKDYKKNYCNCFMLLGIMLLDSILLWFSESKFYFTLTSQNLTALCIMICISSRLLGSGSFAPRLLQAETAW